ncbi:MAG: murein biosynthesis integral membrane protein MurJ [Desulfobacterales bacterium C00003060]|nr:MAG: murein biosynthesis integral membrane protein MurJ [Desulfobacterales bacterium S3730MH5]OEU80132.1 MAG: murein biosynthesis integral membrane protein MurJ [Desulfobacterales bacterium C00003060]OEU80233.1 MAG: murein biosynthesis integral membrane protein MurJ [Desulfobacterales bacterium S5133MH4]
MSETARMTKAAGIVGTATLLSRILGFVRDVIVAWFFGAGMSADAFFVAFRIPNLLRRLFAEGSLTISFIPVFTEYLSRNGREEAFRLARCACWLLSIVLTVVAVAGILLSPLIIHIIAPGFLSSPEKFDLTVILTRIMFPYIFFIGLVALCMGILNALGHFAAPALAPVMLNLAMISAVILFSPHLEKPALGLAIGVIIGGILQLGLQVPFLIRRGFRLTIRGPLYHPAIKRIALLMTPAVFGAAVYQINVFIGTILASLLPEGSISYLYYADRLVQFPLGVFGIAMATALLPSLSRLAAKNDLEGLRISFAYALKLVFFITIPAMTGLIVLKEPIVRLLFQRGAFDVATTRLTAEALFYYALGLWAFSGVRIVVSTFYALQDTKTPVKMAVISLLVNVLLSISLMGPMQHGGLALATSLAAMTNLILLVLALKKRLGRIGAQDIIGSVLKSTAAAAVMGSVIGALALWGVPKCAGSTWQLVVWIFGSIVAGSLLYGVCAFLFRSRELAAMIDIVRSNPNPRKKRK